MKLVLSVEPIRFPLTGIGRYTYELALRLQQSPEITDLQFFAGRRFLPELPTASNESGSGYGLKRRQFPIGGARVAIDDRAVGNGKGLAGGGFALVQCGGDDFVLRLGQFGGAYRRVTKACEFAAQARFPSLCRLPA